MIRQKGSIVMIYIRGDTHGALSCWGEMDDSTWGPSDTLVITGDYSFGLGRSPSAEREKLDKLAKKPYFILFIAGNHENYDWLSALPEEERYGATVRRVRENIFWLQNGYVYTIEDKTFFVMGGAASLKADRDERLSLEARSGIKTWFPQELPTAEEYSRARSALDTVRWTVDVVLTHTGPTPAAQLLSRYPLDEEEAELRSFLDKIYSKVTFRQWYFGHFHRDLRLVEMDERLTVCYKQVYRLE